MRRRLSFESRLLLFPVLATLPGLATAIYCIGSAQLGRDVKWVTAALLVFLSAAPIVMLRRRVHFSLRTVSSLISALREGEYAVRASRGQEKGAFGEILAAVNEFGEALQKQRLGSVESAVLLGKVLEEIDVAVLGFNEQQRLRLFNRRAQALLGQAATNLQDATAAQLGIANWLVGESPRIVDVDFGGKAGRWEIRRGSYYDASERHALLFLSDLTPALREEERQAWRRLLQVLRHEMNNSLAPIQSLAGSLIAILNSSDGAARNDELKEGLEIILNRSKSLSRFMSAYARLRTLPQPSMERLKLNDLVRRVVGLEGRMDVRVKGDPDIEIYADGAQMEQLMINLVRNAVEAASETEGAVEVSWTACHGPPNVLELVVEDNGPGIANSDNLFVPFYTTKPHGSGIGLVLCRQIAESHGASLTLENREDGAGCRARLQLPVR